MQYFLPVTELTEIKSDGKDLPERKQWKVGDLYKSPFLSPFLFIAFYTAK